MTLLAGFPPAEIKRAYELAKLQASVDSAIPEPLLQSWFEAAWDLCATMIGYAPPQEVTERIAIDNRGGFQLSHSPSSEIRVFSGYTLVATIPANGMMSPCDPGLCCFCNLTVKYWTGSASCQISPRFLIAVARVFAHMVEHRGDDDMDDHILTRSGAMTLLGPELTYAL